MKLIAVVLSLVAVAFAVKQETYKINAALATKVKGHSSVCAQENSVDSGLLPKILDGTLPRDDATNKYLFCVTSKTGVITEDGHMNVDKIVSLVGDHPLTGELKAALTKCNEVTKETPIATVVEMNRCLIDTAPIRFAM